MFKKSNKEPQLDAFSSVSSMLDSHASKQYSDHTHWHNQFREQVVMRIDESIFSILFNQNTGAPNASVRILIGMMVLKESFVWSDSQLFEHCRFNLLVRSSLGLFNVNDPLPVESTYYLLRKRIYDHQKQTGEDLMRKAFTQITQGQVKEFDVNGQSIRMDSKLIGSNIAFVTRYEVIHQSLCMFFKSLDKSAKSRLSVSDLEKLKPIIEEESRKTVYRSTREDLKGRLQVMGTLIYKLLKMFSELQTEPFQLLYRVFNEQFKVSEDQQVELRPNQEISSSSVQSPHDPDSTYRNKNKQPVKGYNVNITETCSKDNLNLITNVIVDKANTADSIFVAPAIEASIEVTGQIVEKVYLDGGFQSPDNEDFCKEIDMVYTGIQGAQGRYELEMTTEGLMVTDTQTGELIHAVLAKSRKSSAPKKWRIKSEGKYYYYDQHDIRVSGMRRQMKARPIEELQKRNNVEASVFQLSFPLRNNKSKYRGLIKQKIWTYCRCLWINLVRILNYTKQTCPKGLRNLFYISIPYSYSAYYSVLISLTNTCAKYLLGYSKSRILALPN